MEKTPTRTNGQSEKTMTGTKYRKGKTSTGDNVKWKKNAAWDKMSKKEEVKWKWHQMEKMHARTKAKIEKTSIKTKQGNVKNSRLIWTYKVIHGDLPSMFRTILTDFFTKYLRIYHFDESN
jgi:hypothetical protein